MISMTHLSRVLCLAALFGTSVAAAQPIAPPISAPVEAAFQRLLAAPAVKSALATIEADDERFALPSSQSVCARWVLQMRSLMQKAT
jgi:hypothetical protein